MRVLSVAIPLVLLALPTALATSRKKVFVCEGSTLDLSCPTGTSLHLIRANYGRFSLSVCPTTSSSSSSWSTRCLQPTSLRQLTSECGGRTSCSLTVGSEVFGDPCPGTPKYLQLLYTCRKVGDTSTPSPLLPPWMVALESMRDTVVLGPRTTTSYTTSTTTNTTSSTTTTTVETTSIPLHHSKEMVRRPSMEFLMFIQKKEQERRIQGDNLFLNTPKTITTVDTMKGMDMTIIIAITVSIICSLLILGIAITIVHRLRRREQKAGGNNVYQISSASSASSSSSYLQYSSSSPSTDYSYMLGSDGRTYRTITPMPQYSQTLHPVPVLQGGHQDHLYVDIDNQGQNTQEYRTLDSQGQNTQGCRILETPGSLGHPGGTLDPGLVRGEGNSLVQSSLLGYRQYHQYPPHSHIHPGCSDQTNGLPSPFYYTTTHQ